MKALLLGKHKRSVVCALQHLIDRGVEVAAVVAPQDPGFAVDAQRLDLAARQHAIPLASEAAVYAAIERPGAGDVDLDGVDLVLSFLFWRRIRKPLIELARIGCLNFHPAPLPDFRGVGGYNIAILEGLSSWGASAHFVDEHLDSGDLVRVERFAIDPNTETALSLDIATQARLLDMFRDVIDLVLEGEELSRSPQGTGRYVDAREFESSRKIAPGDAPEVTARRIRAYWYPPYDGATIQLGGRDLTLVDHTLLAAAARSNGRAGIFP